MQTILKSLIAVLALAIAWQASQPRGSKAPNAPVHATDDLRMAPARGVSYADRMNGLAIQLPGGPDVYEKCHRLIPEIAALAADTVLFVVHGWQEHGGSLDLHIDARKTADEPDLGRLCDLATQHHLRIILMPIILLEHPRNNEWRGKIVPESHDWDGWFKRYTSFIVHFADIAERHRVAVLMIGSELIKTETYTQRWTRVIEEVRQHYRGALGYSANWDHYQTYKIGFWPKLDCVGMTTYYELAAAANPLPEEVDANWSKTKSDILAFQREVKKPVIFTEVGWCSQEGAAHEGWNYYANQKATEAGQKEQVLLYESFLKCWSGERSVGGIIWWEWDTTEGGKSDFNYTPRGKPAEGVIRRWFAEESARKAGEEPNAAAGSAR